MLGRLFTKRWFVWFFVNVPKKSIGFVINVMIPIKGSIAPVTRFPAVLVEVKGPHREPGVALPVFFL